VNPNYRTQLLRVLSQLDQSAAKMADRLSMELDAEEIRSVIGARAEISGLESLIRIELTNIACVEKPSDCQRLREADAAGESIQNDRSSRPTG
jgi:hypothetical protein